MATALLIFTTAIRLWPFILAGIKEAEAIFRAPKSGPDKLDSVLAGIDVAYDLTQPLQGLPKDQVLALASKLVTKAVGSMNAAAPAPAA
jgi:hypothetical protein